MSWHKLLSQNLRELRVHFCQTSSASQGLRPAISLHTWPCNLSSDRQYINHAYPTLKSANPNTPILIREASGVEARLFARYDYGVERKVVVDGLDEKEIERKVKELVTNVPSEVSLKERRV